MLLKIPRTNLQQIFTSALLNGRPFPRQSSGMFRPSEASVTLQTPYGQDIRGNCKRKTWFRLKGVRPSEEGPIPHQIQRMNTGKQIENSIIETCKREGIFVDNNIPFRTVMDGIPVAGELDVVLRTKPCGTDKYLAEIKSLYGYYAQKETFGRFIGNGKKDGAPRDSYILQTALYLNYYSRLPKDDDAYLPYGAIFITDRGDGHFGVFDIWLEEELKITGDDEILKCHKIYYASPDMGVPKTLVPYTIEDILSSYRFVQKSIDNNIMPPRDFIKIYNAEQVETKYLMGKISDSKYKVWKGSHGPRGKGKEILGDWNCYNSYCKWSSLCWKKENN
jgi:hypothetical protein